MLLGGDGAGKHDRRRLTPILSSVGIPSNSKKIDAKPQEETSDNVGKIYEEKSGDEDGNAEVILEEKSTETATDSIDENPPIFSSIDAEFDIRLEPSLISNLNSLILSDPTIDFDKWSPVLAINRMGL